MNHVIEVKGHRIGAGFPCFIAAETGINHNGDPELAHRMIDEAADAGVDAVKFQNFRTEDFLSDRSLTYEYQSAGKTVTEPQYDMFKRCELGPEHLAAFREHCDDRGVVFFSTPTSIEGVGDLVSAGAAMLKNGSDYLGHLPLIRAMARTGLPAVLSTGMATEEEVREAADTFRNAGGERLVLLHCVSAYPTPPEDVHLRRIPALAAAMGCPVGFSDHTEGLVAAAGAVALGACFLEKHFTLDKHLPGPDHRFSADPGELRRLVDAIRTAEKNLGSAAIEPAASEQTAREQYRLGCVAARDMEAGRMLEEKDVAFRRPATGLLPRDLDWITGKTLRTGKKAGDPLTRSDLG